MKNSMYIDTLLVSGVINSNNFKDDMDILEDIKKLEIDLRRLIQVYIKNDVYIMQVAYFALCKDLGKVLDRDSDKQRSTEFLNEVCDMLDTRFKIMQRRNLTHLLVNLRKLIDTNNENEVDYENMRKCLKFMKLERVRNRMSIYIEDKPYFISRGARESRNDLEGEFDLENINKEMKCRSISFIVIDKDRNVKYVPSARIKTKDIKEGKLRKYIEDDNIALVIFYDTNSDQFFLNKIESDYVSVEY